MGDIPPSLKLLEGIVVSGFAGMLILRGSGIVLVYFTSGVAKNSAGGNFSLALGFCRLWPKSLLADRDLENSEAMEGDLLYSDTIDLASL